MEENQLKVLKDLKVVAEFYIPGIVDGATIGMV